MLGLAFPLIANSAVQIVLNLTDVWFIGRISTTAVASVGAVQWLVIVVVMLLGGVGMAVQTVVAQAYGARRYARASQAVWTALWGTLDSCCSFAGAPPRGSGFRSERAGRRDYCATHRMSWPQSQPP